MTPRPGFRDVGTDRDDPTGMRSLLSSLPDPAPMPDGVAARIEASLADAAAEFRREPAPGEPGTPPWASTWSRAGRASSQTIGALAAGFLVIAGAGVFGLQSLRSGDSSPPPMVVTPPATHRSPSQTLSTGSSPSSPGAGPRSAPPAPQFTASRTAYTRGNLAEHATALWIDAAASHPSFALPSLAAEQPGIGPLATPLGLSDCIAALGIDAPDRIVADFARYEQRPAAVLVTASGTTLQVHVVERTCRSGRPGVITEPVVLAMPRR